MGGRADTKSAYWRLYRPKLEKACLSHSVLSKEVVAFPLPPGGSWHPRVDTQEESPPPLCSGLREHIQQDTCSHVLLTWNCSTQKTTDPWTGWRPTFLTMSPQAASRLSKQSDTKNWRLVWLQSFAHFSPFYPSQDKGLGAPLCEPSRPSPEEKKNCHPPLT